MDPDKSRKNKGLKNLRRGFMNQSDGSCIDNHGWSNNSLKSAINDKYLTAKFKQSVIECWQQDGPPVIQDDDGLEVMWKPFSYAFLPKILSDEKLLNSVAEELQEVGMVKKNNDLYETLVTVPVSVKSYEEFNTSKGIIIAPGLLDSSEERITEVLCSQGVIQVFHFKKFSGARDLKAVKKKNIQLLCRIIRGPLKNWVQEVSGISLNEKVSISSSLYQYADTLLCHDDELDGRRIAFILYLVPTWQREFGGSLDLFGVDRHGRPHLVEKRLYPQFNSFAFFKVSPVSYHQVSEVLVRNHKRISVNGWYYGTPIRYPPRYFLRPPVYVPPGHIEEHMLYTWVNPLYLDQNTQFEVRREFKEKSEIQLSEFLKLKKYEELSSALRSLDQKWRWTGPPYKRHMEVLRRKDSSPVIREFLKILQSEAMFLILSQLTGLCLHRLAADESDSSDDDPECNTAYRCDEDVSSVSHEEFSNIDKVTTREIQNTGKSSQPFTSGAKRRVTGKNEKKSKKKKQMKSDCTSSSCTFTSEDAGFSLDQEWESDVEREALSEIKANTDAGDAKGEVTMELRKWRWGSYSLMRDDDLRHIKNFVLDTMFFCNGSKDWNMKFGGGTVYVAKGEEEQLLTVLPVPNSMALVYRDSQIHKFTKYINIKSRQLGGDASEYQEFACEYREIDKT